MYYANSKAKNEYVLLRVGQIVWFTEFYQGRHQFHRAKVIKLENCFTWAMKTSQNFKVRDFSLYVVVKSLDKKIEFYHGSGGNISPIQDGIYLSKAEAEKSNFEYGLKEMTENRKFQLEYKYNVE